MEKLRISPPDSLGEEPSRYIEIYPKLVLGNAKAAEDFSLLKELNVGVMVTVGDGSKHFPEHFKYITLTTSDNELLYLDQYFDLTHRLFSSLQREGSVVFVYGHVVYGFSSVIVLSYIIQREQITLREAMNFLIEKGAGEIVFSEFSMEELLKLEENIHGERITKLDDIAGLATIDQGYPDTPEGMNASRSSVGNQGSFVSSVSSSDSDISNPVRVGMVTREYRGVSRRKVELSKLFLFKNGDKGVWYEKFAYAIDVATILIAFVFVLYIFNKK